MRQGAPLSRASVDWKHGAVDWKHGGEIVPDLQGPPSSSPAHEGDGAPRDAIDAAILDAIGKGDQDLAAALIVRHLAPLLRGQAWALVRPDCVDDVLQDTILLLLEALKKGRFRGKSSLSTYAIQVVRHRAFHVHASFWQRLLRRARDPGDGEDLPAPFSNRTPWGDRDPEELAARLVERLEGPERVVVTLRLEGAAFPAIARRLQISEDRAYKLHSRAVARLRAELAEAAQGGDVPRSQSAAEAPPAPVRRHRRSG